jgi:hypothetical protein
VHLTAGAFTAPPFEISGFDVGLYQVTGLGGDPVSPLDDVITMIPATTSMSGGLLMLDYAGLATGITYLFRAVGEVTGTTGIYSGEYSVTAVPLPPALILLGSALLGLTVFGRIRRTSI